MGVTPDFGVIDLMMGTRAGNNGQYKILDGQLRDAGSTMQSAATSTPRSSSTPTWPAPECRWQELSGVPFVVSVWPMFLRHNAERVLRLH